MLGGASFEPIDSAEDVPERGHRAASAQRTVQTGIVAMTTNITEEHHRVFEALTSGEHDNFALFSCFLGTEPAAAIVAVNRCPPAEEGGEPEYEYVISPIFVGIVPGMKLTDHDRREA